MTYGIKNTANGQFFGGFTQDFSVLWVGQAQAWASDLFCAKAQAACLIANGHTAQRKPVAA